MKCNYCYRRPTVVIKTKFKLVKFDMYLCNDHSKKEKSVIIMQLSNKEQELLSTYQNWLKKNKLNDKCNAYFISQTSMLIFQVWDLEKLISETIWLKTNNQEWQFYTKTLWENLIKLFL